ncbi:MAG: helix-turn-helix domain-containing protein, partial [Myxococcota bacterium]
MSPLVEALLHAMGEDPDGVWSQTRLVEAGFDPSTVRRAFKRHFGMTFLAFARLRRLQRGSSALAGGARVIDAQLEAGFDSGSGFRAALAKLLSVPPASLTQNHGSLWVDWLDTALGPMIAVADDTSLHLLEFADRRALGGELRRLRTRMGELSIGRTRVIDGLEAELEAFFA